MSKYLVGGGEANRLCGTLELLTVWGFVFVFNSAAEWIFLFLAQKGGHPRAGPRPPSGAGGGAAVMTTRRRRRLTAIARPARAREACVAGRPGGRAGSAAAGVLAAAGRGAAGTAGARQWAHSGPRGAGVEKLRGGRWRAGAAAALFAFQWDPLVDSVPGASAAPTRICLCWF